MTTAATMSFVSTTDYRFSWPVNITRPHPLTPGETETQTFTGHFRLLDDEQSVTIGQLHADARGSVQKTLDAYKANVRAVLVGWDGRIVDEKLSSIPFTPEALEQLMRFGPFRVGVINAYAEAVSKGPAEGN